MPTEKETTEHRLRPGLATIVDRFHEQVFQTPDAEALRFQNRTWSYRELDHQANGLAGELHRRGVGPDVRVAIHMERSAEFIISILAVLKAGGAYVPLDPSYPTGRLEMMIEEANPLLLLTQETLETTLELPSDLQTLIIDRESGLLAEGSPRPVDSVVSVTDLAYVLFTSGSTGRPKGVAMPHGPLARLIDWQCNRSELGTGDRTLQFSALSFDVSFQEIFSTWCSGGTLVLISEEDRKDALTLLRLLEDEQVKRLFLPFVALQHIAEMAEAKNRYPSHLREVITAGEQLKSVPSVRTFFRRTPGCSLENQYGPTESHVVTAYRLPANVDDWEMLPPIGQAIPSARIYLLDEDEQPVEDGETGEIYIGGDCLAREYLNLPEQTAQRFLPDPFAAGPNSRMYRTGDLARTRSDGEIEYLGRADHQVKVRGYRVELGEIEAVLNLHESVREAVVVPDQGEAQGNQRLIAFVIAQPDRATNPAVLHEFLSGKLPAYMVPSAFNPVENFPLTPSGKVDRKALATQSCSAALREKQDVASPRTELERILVKLWEDALGIRPIGIREDFFSVGGHSIMAAEMLVKLSTFLGRELPLSLLADTPTIESLAEKIESGEDRKEWSVLVPIRRTGDKPPLFCIHGGGREVLRFRGLAALLDDDQPVYALQWAGLNGDPVPSTIEAVAEQYLAEIRTVQPTGPYFLAGHCYGGVVAYHIAQVLREQGESVELLAMMDPQVVGTNAKRPATFYREISQALLQLWRRPSRLAQKLRSILALRTRFVILKTLIRGNTLPPEVHEKMNQPGMASLFRLFRQKIPRGAQKFYGVQVMERALTRYQPGPLSAPTIVFYRDSGDGGPYFPPRQESTIPQDPTQNPGVAFYEIDADHDTIVHHPRTAALLAEHLKSTYSRLST